jgi:hypothetical protein
MHKNQRDYSFRNVKDGRILKEVGMKEQIFLFKLL